MNNTVVLPPIKIGRKFVEDLDEFVKAGYFRSRSEAVRDAVKMMVVDLRKKAIIKEAVQATRAARREMWAEALKEAKGDDDLARGIYIKKFA
ncbi:MAG: ribbon-helix-helix domain-containing protein [Candidatus Micrarchaeota archaeon]